jgi:hypothetical protein
VNECRRISVFRTSIAADIRARHYLCAWPNVAALSPVGAGLSLSPCGLSSRGILTGGSSPQSCQQRASGTRLDGYISASPQPTRRQPRRRDLCSLAAECFQRHFDDDVAAVARQMDSECDCQEVLYGTDRRDHHRRRGKTRYHQQRLSLGRKTRVSNSSPARSLCCSHGNRNHDQEMHRSAPCRQFSRITREPICLPKPRTS